jgi:hypothetical protein
MDINEATEEWVQATATAAGLNDGLVTWQEYRPDWPPADGNQHAAYLEAIAEMETYWQAVLVAESTERGEAA